MEGRYMISIVGWSESPPSITFAIAGARYEYDLPTITVLDAILYIRKQAGAGVALNQAKRKAIATRRLN